MNKNESVENCIFCKIASGKIPAEKIYENEFVFVINDINPEAPIHLLVITKTHINDLNELHDENLFKEIFKAIKIVTKKLNVKEYKTLINTGSAAGQMVFHLHVHIIGDVSKE